MTEEVQSKEQEMEGPYRGKYRSDVYNKNDTATLEDQEVEAQQNDDNDEETISLLSSEKKQEHDYKKRYDDLKKHYDSKLDEWKQEKEDLVFKKELNETYPDSDSEKSNDEELSHFKETYPDVYNVMEAVSTKNAAKEVEELRSEIERLNQKEAKLTVKAAYQELIALHPDFSEIKKSEDFREWLKDQPPSIADGIANNSTDVKWASRVLDLYKADTGQTKKRGRPSKNAAAEAVTKTRTVSVNATSNANKKTWTTSEIRKLKPQEYEKFEKEIDQARVEGRISNS